MLDRSMNELPQGEPAVGEPLEGYFEGRIAEEHVVQRAREITSRRFLGGADFLR
jgi:hypothetical protein